MSGTVAPLTFTSSGPQPQSPVSLYGQIITNAESLVPGASLNLPGALLDDVAGTDTAALVLIDQARVDALNSISPFTANPWVLLQLGQIYLGLGSTSAPASNTAVYVVFTGPVGFIIPVGFIVSDGTYQYTVQDGGVIETGETSAPLFCLATQSGSWAVPANSVTQLVTSIPSGLPIAVTVTNPLAGTPGADAQTEADFRAQVMQAGLVGSTGMPNMLRTLLQKVPGVQARLISIRQQPGAWEIIVGGTGDPYAIGNAIFQALFDISTLTGSVLAVTGITNANPAVVTTNLNHGFNATQPGVEINGAVGISGVNGVLVTATTITENSFSIPIDTTSSGAWTNGGVVTPNFRNVSVSLNDYPDTYTVPFVVPPMQTVTMTVTWNTSSPNFVSPSGVAQLVQPAIAAYINSIVVGAPINVLELNQAFLTAVSGILNPTLVTRLIFTVSINGIVTDPVTGTETIVGDPESYFACAASGIVVIQG